MAIPEASRSVRADPRGKPVPITYPLRRDGELGAVYNGWKIDGFYKRAETDEDSSEPAPADDEPTEGESSPQTPEQKAAAYRDCIEGRGAEDVKEDGFPTVDFSGGGSRVTASFGSSVKDAEEGFAAISQGDPFFAPALRHGGPLLGRRSPRRRPGHGIGLRQGNWLGASHGKEAT